MHGNARHHAPHTDKRRSSRIVLLESTGKRVLEQSRLRLACLALVFLFSFLAIGGRLIDVSLRGFGNDTAASLAEYRANKPKYPRSEIIDRNGEMLATTLRTASLYANPRIIREPKQVAAKLARIFPEVGEKELSRRLHSDRAFIWLKRHLTPKQQKQVNDLGIPGLNFEPELKRVYPHAGLMAHVLGYVDVDSRGMAGIERGFEEFLRNEDGKGEPLQLSIDMRVQAILREELRASVKEFQALGAVGVMMDIRTGELIAMTSLPDFDPHEPGRAKDEAKFNRATLGVYEMGSTFKTFTVAAALETGVANMQSGYDATKPMRVARFTISDAYPKSRWLSVPEIFAYSSNIGTVKMIMDVGTERQKQFLSSLGLMEPVKTEIPESASPLLPNPWREINTMTISYGHGMAVTPLQLVRAMGAVAGDGHLPHLTFVKGGNKGKPKGERVLSQQNVQNMRKLLRLVVAHGTGAKSDAEGYRVGGKTGTAEKLNPAGGYKRDAKIVSFAGAFPIDDPRYVLLVMVDEPKGNKSTYGYATGGWIAAPLAGRIVERVGPLMGIRPVYDMPGKGGKNQPWVYYDGEGVHAVSF